MNNIENKPYYSTVEAAKILGMSRIAVFKKIRSGQLKSERFGRNYLIPQDSLAYSAGFLTALRRKELDSDVRRIIKQYGDALRRLSKE